MKRDFIERTLASLLAASDYAACAEDLAGSSGVLQRVDPRVKVAGLLALILVAAGARRIEAIAVIFISAVLLALASRVRLRRLAG